MKNILFLATALLFCSLSLSAQNSKNAIEFSFQYGISTFSNIEPSKEVWRYSVINNGNLMKLSMINFRWERDYN